MIYYNTNTGERLAESQIQAIPIEVGKSWAEVGIVILEEAKPAEYDPRLYTTRDDGNEQFSEEREVQVPNFQATDPTNMWTTQTVTVSGWRIKWTLVPRDIATVQSVLVEYLSAKKKEIEDGGITLSNGISLATTEVDRNRVLAMKAAWDDNPDNPLLDTLKFKDADNKFQPFDKSMIVPIFRVMRDRTLQIFAREAAIQEAFFSLTDPAEAIAAYKSNYNTGWPASTNVAIPEA